VHDGVRDILRVCCFCVLFPMMGPSMTWIIAPRMILLPFALGQWLLVWSLRFVPRSTLSSALSNQILKGVVAVAASAGVIVEIFLYRSLTGQDSLKNDNFFFAVVIGQSLVVMFLAFKSGAILKERHARLRSNSQGMELPNSR
jgi:hypothetical protein